MAGLSPRLMIGFQVAFQFINIHSPHRQENGKAQAAYPLKAVAAAGRQADFGMGFLVGQGSQPGVADVVMLAFVGKGFPPPGLQDDVQGFLKAFPAFPVVNAHRIVGADVAAAPHAELKAALADLIHGGRFLGNPQGMHQGQDVHRRPDPQPFRAGGDGAGDNHLRRMDRPFRGKVRLAQPHRIQAQLVGPIHQLKGAAKSILVGIAPVYRKLQKCAKIQGHNARS